MDCGRKWSSRVVNVPSMRRAFFGEEFILESSTNSIPLDSENVSSTKNILSDIGACI